MTLTELDAEGSAKEWALVNVSDESFGALKASIDKRFPDAIGGRPYAISDTGEEYISFCEFACCRSNPFDIEVAKRSVLTAMARRLSDYLTETEGQLFWRVIPEEEIVDSPQVILFSETAPDTEPVTGRRCFLDRGWKRYEIYTRLLRSKAPILHI